MIGHINSALYSIWSNKVRSLLTVLGVVIGVASVTTLISLGQGLKSEVSGLIQGFGTNVLVIISGKIDTSTGSGGFGGGNTNPANFIAGDILTRQDVDTIKALPGIDAVAPISLVAGAVKYEETTATPIIFGTSPDIIRAFQVLSLEKGRMFASENVSGEAVVGELTSNALFGEDVDPVGKTININRTDFTITGKLGKAKFSALFGSEYDNLILISTADATKFNKDQEKIMRITVKAENDADVETVKQSIVSALIPLREDGEQNFSVLTQDDLLGLLNQFVDLSTALVSAIAAISLIVGGIGIMNIMLVTVTERTAEIGLRKAVGATKFAIMIQFLTEAIAITLLGGLIGLAISVVVSIIVAANTPLTPEVTPEVIILASAISTIIGVIFGLWPAMRAANKDPIEALRHE